MSHVGNSSVSGHSCSEVVFALSVSSCENKVRNKMLTTCNKLDGTIRLVTRLLQQDWYSHDITMYIATAFCCQHCDNLDPSCQQVLFPKN